MKSCRRSSSQRGSALLIVLVFAAIIAIALYRELPVATFEAERQKEQLLIDRGNEYKRGVQLYVRKLQSFPPSIDALENTNRMRFLRARYVDPFTGKDDWRILHAGPGGVIIDSKLKPTASSLAGAAGAAGASASTLGAPSSVTNPFSNSFNGADPTGQLNASGNNFPQRPPAVAATGGASPTGADMYANQNAQPTDSQTLAVAAAMQNAAGPTSTNQSSANPPMPYSGYSGPPNPALANGTSSGTFPVGPGRFRGGTPTGSSFPPGQYGNDTASMGVVQDMQNNPMAGALQTQNPPPTVQPGGLNPGVGQPTTSSPGMGSMNPNSMGSGIAGVASKSVGKTIKVINDQTDRSLWEFVYDMQKEALANAPGLGGNAAGNSGVGSGNSPTPNPTTSSIPPPASQPSSFSN